MHKHEDGHKLLVFTLIFLSFFQVLLFTTVRYARIDDVFHLGEFATSALAIIHNTSDPSQSFTIHGALNYWPYLLADSLSTNLQRGISYSLIFLFNIIQAVVIILSLLFALRLIKIFSLNPIVMIPFSIFVCGLAFSHKEIFFLITIYMLTFSNEYATRGGRSAVIFFIFFGLIAAIGVYWSFDRGLAIIGCVGLPLLAVSLRRRIALISSVSFIISFFGLPYILPGISVAHYVENIFLLLRTSENWRYADPNLQLLAFIALVNIIACLLAARMLYLERQINQKSIIILALILSSILFYKMGTNRLDMGHAVSAFWVPLVLFALVAPKTESLRTFTHMSIAMVGFFGVMIVIRFIGANFPYPALEFRLSVGAFSVLLFSVSILFKEISQRRAIPVLRGVSTAALSLINIASALMIVITVWHGVRNLQGDVFLSGIVNLPPDNELVSEDMLWLAESISETDAKCLFDFTNMGVVNALTKLPPCTQYSYIVYGDLNDEARIISQLQASAPPVVLYSSENWSYSIDGKSMRDRFPLVEVYMLNNYPKEICNYGHCLRFKLN